MRRFSMGYLRAALLRYPINADTSTDRPVIHYGPVLLHSADILPGNSGGPLINENGEVVALNTKMIRALTPADKKRQSTDNYFYCASAPLTQMNCQNLSISADLIADELEKLF